MVQKLMNESFYQEYGLRLDPKQREAVDSTKSKVVIWGEAATGKTHPLIARLIRLLREGVDPRGIYLLVSNETNIASIRSRFQSSTTGSQDTASVGVFTSVDLASDLLRMVRSRQEGDGTYFSLWDREQALAALTFHYGSRNKEFPLSVLRRGLDYSRWMKSSILAEQRFRLASPPDDKSRVVERVYR